MPENCDKYVKKINWGNTEVLDTVDYSTMHAAQHSIIQVVQ